jgi:hypothetical protein
MQLSQFTHRAMISRLNRQHDCQYKRERCICCCNLNLVNQDKKLPRKLEMLELTADPRKFKLMGLTQGCFGDKFVKGREMLMCFC